MPTMRVISNAELDEIIREHEKWLSSREKEGRRADLSNCIITAAPLQDVNLQRANFEHSNLRTTNFANAKLKDANFSYADCRFANFTDAEVVDANFSHADLSFATFLTNNLANCNVDRADFSQATVNTDVLFKLKNADKAIGLPPITREAVKDPSIEEDEPER